MIITKTPFRMSFFGGGTDMESFFMENGGAVLSTTFDKYCYVNVRHLPRFFDYSTELSYAKIERVTDVNDIQHPAIREAMKMLDDVKNTKLDNMFDKIRQTIEEGGLTDMVNLVEEHVNQEEYTSMDMAAALLKMLIGDTLDREDEVEEFHFDTDKDDSRMVRLFINIGKKDRIKPANILGAIAGESGMPGKLVGAIDMMDNYTFVDVPAIHAEKILKAMNDNVQIKGRRVNVEKANQSRGKGRGKGKHKDKARKNK